MTARDVLEARNEAEGPQVCYVVRSIMDGLKIDFDKLAQSSGSGSGTTRIARRIIADL